MKERKRFEYHARTKEQLKKRIARSGGLYDPIFSEQFMSFAPKEGDQRIRILPPTWDNPEHYGIDIFVHFGVGADNQSYLCLEKNQDFAPEELQGVHCPICDERRRAEKAGDVEYAKSLNPTKRVLIWMVDRSDEDQGPILWGVPWTVDRDFSTISLDRESGDVLCTDDPEEGFDILFTRQGTKQRTKYVGAAIARRSTPLSDDAEVQESWLRFIKKNPLPSVLKFFPPDHIAKIFAGKEEEEEEEERKPATRRSRFSEEEEDDQDTHTSKSSKKTRDREDLEEEADKAFKLGEHRSRDTEEDEEEDEDLDDRDSIPDPRKGGKKARKEEDDDLDEEGSRSSVHSKKKPHKSREEEEDEEEEEEDEKPRSFSRSSSDSKRSSPKNQADDEDEEEDEKPSSKSSSRQDRIRKRLHNQ